MLNAAILCYARIVFLDTVLYTASGHPPRNAFIRAALQLEARVGIEPDHGRSKTRLNRSAAETSLSAALAIRLAESFREIKPALLNNRLRLAALFNTFSARFSARLWPRFWG